MKFFSVDSPLYRFLSKLLDVIRLNFLWILFSIPLVTIGASTVAALSVALKMADDEEGYIGRSFLKAFRENWKQGTVLGLITLVALYAIYLDFQFFEALEGNPMIFLLVGILSIVVVVSALLYAYPLAARSKIHCSEPYRIPSILPADMWEGRFFWYLYCLWNSFSFSLIKP